MPSKHHEPSFGGLQSNEKEHNNIHDYNKRSNEPPPRFYHLEHLIVRVSDNSIRSLAGATSAIASSIITSPLDVIKVKLQGRGGLQLWTLDSVRRQRSLQERGLIGTRRAIWHQGGLIGMYQGLGPIILADIPRGAIYFAVYHKINDSLKKVFSKLLLLSILDILSKHEQPDQVFIEALHRSFGNLVLSSMKYGPGSLTGKQKSKASQLRKDLQDQFCQLLLHPQFKSFIDHPQHKYGPAMIQQAAYLVHLFTVQVLLEAGADASRPLRRGDYMILPLELACITGRGLYATKEVGEEYIEGTKYITIDQAMEVATELLQFHQARADGLFEGITELHLASRMVYEDAIAKLIEQGHRMDSKGRWHGVEHMATPRELGLLSLHDKVGVSYTDLIPSFDDELLGEQAVELLDVFQKGPGSSEDSSSVHTDDLDY